MTIKNIAGKASFQLVKLILILTRILPVRCSYGLCSFAASVGSSLRWKRKTIALKNLLIVFPDKSEKERRSIFRESLRNMLKNYVEMAFIINGKYGPDKIKEMVNAAKAVKNQPPITVSTPVIL